MKISRDKHCLSFNNQTYTKNLFGDINLRGCAIVAFTISHSPHPTGCIVKFRDTILFIDTFANVVVIHRGETLYTRHATNHHDTLTKFAASASAGDRRERPRELVLQICTKHRRFDTVRCGFTIWRLVHSQLAHCADAQGAASRNVVCDRGCCIEYPRVSQRQLITGCSTIMQPSRAIR